MRPALVVLAFVSMLAEAPAADLGVSADRFVGRFEMTARGGAIPVLVLGPKCSEQTASGRFCTYKLGLTISAIAAVEPSGMIGEIRLVFGKEGDRKELFAAVVTSLRLFEPEVDELVLAEKLNWLFEGFSAGQPAFKSEALVGRTRYVVASDPDTGLIVTISRPS